MVQSNDGDSNARPTEYTPEIGKTICDRLVEGHSIYRICSDPTMPTRATLREWLARNENFRKRFALLQGSLAMEFQDEILEIVDSLSNRVEKVRRGGKVIEEIDSMDFARTRLRLDVRCWVADQRNPNVAAKFTIPRKGYRK
jgi:hypothetical protein